jgi:hypothetical protein
MQLGLYDKNIDKGFICPCCGSFCKTYHRKLNSSMTQVLILIYKSCKLDYFHVENMLKSLNKGDLRADFHKLRHWGLIKKKVENREDGSARNGFYRITPAGIMFVEGKITVRETILIFNNEFKGFEGENINIYQALGNKFDYNKLMNNN